MHSEATDVTGGPLRPAWRAATMQPVMDASRHGVASEVGRLGTVMLHRPGSELRRLTPRNNDHLLFDGVPWVDRAQEEHDAFADALRGHGVEVLYARELLEETLAVPEARAQLLEPALDPQLDRPHARGAAAGAARRAAAGRARRGARRRARARGAAGLRRRWSTA